MKVVLAAAMWNSPHMLVLDEPTNYLDRESLGALAAAIKTYGGGVVMISHHSGEPHLFVQPPASTCCLESSAWQPRLFETKSLEGAASFL